MAYLTPLWLTFITYNPYDLSDTLIAYLTPLCLSDTPVPHGLSDTPMVDLTPLWNVTDYPWHYCG